MIESILLGFVASLITNYSKKHNIDSRIIVSIVSVALAFVYAALTHVSAVSVKTLVNSSVTVLAFANLVYGFVLKYFPAIHIDTKEEAEEEPPFSQLK